MQQTTETKVCFKCNVEQPKGCFYRHPKMADGRFGKCKKCTKMDAVSTRERRIEHYREYDRRRGNRQTAEYVRAYRRGSPEKYKAHMALGNAVRDGKVVKPTECEVCGVAGGILHGHHADYSRPLDVLWCCPVCHKAQHKQQDQTGGSSQ